MDVKSSICRSCNAFCPVDVTLDEGRIVKIAGNRRAPIYHGYSCPKGRAQSALHHHPDRLLTSLKRQPDGSFEPISSERLVNEIADKIGALLESHGASSIAAYLSGGVIEQPAASALMNSFLSAIGSRQFYTASTIDQPGMPMAYALHGRWQAGRIHPEKCDVFLICGGNPLNSKQYLPQNPALQIKHMHQRGAKLIVIDPRRTETARLADMHLQPIPGEDPTIFAGLVHLIIAEGGVNSAFVAANAQGLAALAEAVKPFTPAYVAARAGVDEGDLRKVARMLIEAERGDVGLGTGSSMATRGTICSYLAVCMNTLRGWWAAPGDDAMFPPVLTTPRDFRAQPSAPQPAWGFGRTSRVRGLKETSAGLPVAALPDEILMPGEGQIKALFLHGGVLNTWPEQKKTIEALRALDLLVIHDLVLSPTAKMANYVIATKMQYETPAFTLLNEMISIGGHPGYHTPDPFAMCQPAIAEPPPGSDLLESWQTYYRVSRKLGLPLKMVNWRSAGGEPPMFDMVDEPSTDDIYDLMCQGSFVSLDEVRGYPDGHVFERARRTVLPRDPDCHDRFELADADMMAELGVIATESIEARRKLSPDFPFQLIPSRMQNSSNTFFRVPGVIKWGYNPAFMNPLDMADLQVTSGDEVRIRSRHGEVTAFVEQDAGLRRGVLALMHGFGGTPDKNYDPRRDGANVNQLTAWEDDNDPHTGMPRMGALPIQVIPVRPPAFATVQAGSGATAPLS